MGIIIWLIVGGVCGWLASLIMRTDAQQGIILNIVVGIVGAVIAGLLFGVNMNAGITDRELPLRAARRGHPAGDREPDSPRHGPLDATNYRQMRRPRGIGRAAFFVSLQLEGHRDVTCSFCSPGSILVSAACAISARAYIGIGGGGGIAAALADRRRRGRRACPSDRA